ncbi:hypothetical protein C0J52_07087 [Blattella germanica]|nr:hypothetical protein C0J52_07087 [Blattella germanica]
MREEKNWIALFTRNPGQYPKRPYTDITVLVCLAVMASVALAQHGDYEHFFGGPNPGSGPSINSIPANQNTGPVLFPNSPDGGETSGVIVGASGYGFVPPRSSIGKL